MNRLAAFLFLIGMFGFSKLNAQNAWEKNTQFEGGVVNDLITLTDSEYLFATSQGLIKGNLTGNVQKIQSANLTRVRYSKLFRAADSTIWAGSDYHDGKGGTNLFKSTDNGTTWIGVGDTKDINSLNTLFVQDIIENKSGDLFIATYHNTKGVIRKKAGSELFEKLTVATTADDVSDLFITSNDLLLAAIYGRGCYWSDDIGETWNKSTGDLGTVNSITQLGDTVFCASTKGVFKSIDGKAFTQTKITSATNSLIVHDNKLYWISSNSVYMTEDKFTTQPKLGGSITATKLVFLNNNLIGFGSKVWKFNTDKWEYQWFGFDQMFDFVQLSNGKLLIQTANRYLIADNWNSEWSFLETEFLARPAKQNMVVTKNDQVFLLNNYAKIKSSTNLVDWNDVNLPQYLNQVERIEITDNDEIIISGYNTYDKKGVVYGKLPSDNAWTLLFETKIKDEKFDGISVSGNAIYGFYTDDKVKFKTSFSAAVDSILYDKADVLKYNYLIDAVYLGNNEHLFVSNGSGTFYTANRGVDWESRSKKMYNTSSEIHFINDTLFVPHNLGIYISIDTAKSWQALDSGLDNEIMYHMEQGKDGFLYTLSYSYGLYRSTKSYQVPTATESEQKTTNFALSQNFPNPFNPSTTIQFSLQKSGLTSLKVFDVLGKEIATLTNGNLNSGLHSFVFDASKLASGLFFYRLESAGNIETKKMLLIK